MMMSALAEKQMRAPPCSNPEVPVVSDQPSEVPTPSAGSLRPEDPRASTSPGRSDGMPGHGGQKELTEGYERSEGCLRERLEQHRREMAGRVRIPDAWGQELFLQSWVDCSAFERFLPEGLALARVALVEDCRQVSPRRLVDDCGRTSASRVEIVNRC